MSIRYLQSSNLLFYIYQFIYIVSQSLLFTSYIVWCVGQSASKQFTAQKMKFSTKDFFSKCDHLSFLRIWSHLLKKSLAENFIFCFSNAEVRNFEKHQQQEQQQQQSIPDTAHLMQYYQNISPVIFFYLILYIRLQIFQARAGLWKVYNF